MKVQIPLRDLIDGESKYSVHYVDNPPNVWSVPVLLTSERADKFLSDLSIDKVKIYTDTTEFELDLINR